MRKNKSLHNIKTEISPGGLVFLALAVYLCEPPFILAVFTAALAHELGHILCMSVLGLSPSAVRFGAGGPCISYRGRGAAGELVCALSGPAVGLIFAFAMSWLTECFGGGFLPLCAGISLSLSLFNLLPALPLDGGRALEAALACVTQCGAARRITEAVSLLVLSFFLAVSLYFAVEGRGLALLSAALWLFWACLAELGIVKSGEMI